MYGTWSINDGNDAQFQFSEINKSAQREYVVRTVQHFQKHNHTSMASTTLNFESLTLIRFDPLAKTSFPPYISAI